jgi:hypothetical protein
MSFFRAHHIVAVLALLVQCSCQSSGTKFDDPETDGNISHITGGWVSDTFKGKRNALLVRPDGKAEYTYSERKPGEDEDEVEDAVFEDRGGTVIWTVDLVYKGKNTWAAANPIQIQGPMPVPFPYEPESEWTFDHSWRLEKGYLYDVKSGHRYMNVRDWARATGAAAPASPAPAPAP